MPETLEQAISNIYNSLRKQLNKIAIPLKTLSFSAASFSMDAIMDSFD